MQLGPLANGSVALYFRGRTDNTTNAMADMDPNFRMVSLVD